MSTKIISWNVNGLRACVAKNTFYPFVEEEKPDPSLGFSTIKV